MTIAPEIAPEIAPGTTPASDVTVGTADQAAAHDPSWTHRAARLSASASRSAGILSEVLNARYAITGTPDRPELRVHCVVAQGSETARIVETLTEDMVETLEGLLGTPFAARHAIVDTAEV